jgi:hypothetical protein
MGFKNKKKKNCSSLSSTFDSSVSLVLPIFNGDFQSRGILYECFGKAVQGTDTDLFYIAVSVFCSKTQKLGNTSSSLGIVCFKVLLFYIKLVFLKKVIFGRFISPQNFRNQY